MSLISHNINEGVTTTESDAWIGDLIGDVLTKAGFKVTYFLGLFPFAKSIQGAERERLLRICEYIPLDSRVADR